jgi:hypothetical protein
MKDFFPSAFCPDLKCVRREIGGKLSSLKENNSPLITIPRKRHSQAGKKMNHCFKKKMMLRHV